MREFRAEEYQELIEKREQRIQELEEATKEKEIRPAKDEIWKQACYHRDNESINSFDDTSAFTAGVEWILENYYPQEITQLKEELQKLREENERLKTLLSKSRSIYKEDSDLYDKWEREQEELLSQDK